MLSNYGPGLIETCRKAAAWSDVLARKYLEHSMFSDPDGGTGGKNSGVIDGIVSLLTDLEVTKSHSRHIPMRVLKGAGMKVMPMEDDQGLQDAILSIHHAAAFTMSNTHAVKIIESQIGQPFVTTHGGGQGSGTAAGGT